MIEIYGYQLVDSISNKTKCYEYENSFGGVGLCGDEYCAFRTSHCRSCPIAPPKTCSSHCRSANCGQEKNEAQTQAPSAAKSGQKICCRSAATAETDNCRTQIKNPRLGDFLFGLFDWRTTWPRLLVILCVLVAVMVFGIGAIGRAVTAN